MHMGRHLIYWGLAARKLKSLTIKEKVATHAHAIRGTPVSMAIKPHLSSKVVFWNSYKFDRILLDAYQTTYEF